MGSLQQHKCLAVTIVLMLSTFQCSPVGPLSLSISFCSAFSSEDKNENSAKCQIFEYQERLKQLWVLKKTVPR